MANLLSSNYIGDFGQPSLQAPNRVSINVASLSEFPHTNVTFVDGLQAVYLGDVAPGGANFASFVLQG